MTTEGTSRPGSSTPMSEVRHECKSCKKDMPMPGRPKMLTLLNSEDPPSNIGVPRDLSIGASGKYCDDCAFEINNLAGYLYRVMQGTVPVHLRKRILLRVEDALERGEKGVKDDGQEG